MNGMSTPHADQGVTDYVERVRALLDDLDEETRTDLVEGLEADLADLVAERGSVALPTPEQYADELRAAAGLPARRGTALLRDRVRRRQRRGSQPVAGRFDEACDRWRRRVMVQVERPQLAAAWGVAQALRPAWWVVRGYLLVQAADVLTGHWESLDLVPQLGVPMLGPALTVLAVVLSVQVGRGVVWPGDPGREQVSARAALLALNAGALVLAGPVLDAADRVGPDVIALRDASHYVDRSGLRLDGRPICNLMPYDAQGRPLVGVQLLDQDGDPVSLSCRSWDAGSGGAQHYPWLRGEDRRWNVFPQPERAGDRRVKDEWWESEEPPTLPQPEVLRLPEVTLPGAAEEPRGPEKGAAEEPRGREKAGRSGLTRRGEAGRGDRADGDARD